MLMTASTTVSGNSARLISAALNGPLRASGLPSAVSKITDGSTLPASEVPGGKSCSAQTSVPAKPMTMSRSIAAKPPIHRPCRDRAILPPANGLAVRWRARFREPKSGLRSLIAGGALIANFARRSMRCSSARPSARSARASSAPAAAVRERPSRVGSLALSFGADPGASIGSDEGIAVIPRTC